MNGENFTTSENTRLAKLLNYNIENTYEKSGTFQHVASLAAHIYNVPMALVNFVLHETVLTESGIGIDAGTHTDREFSLCSKAILKEEVTVFKDIKQEPCLKDNPIVNGVYKLQFYAAAPIKTPDGHRIGVVAIADKKPREFSVADEQLLKGLAEVVIQELEEKLILNS
ncbi:GAF domain-containing protein [Adhaeribacter aquaticus]|uniref:GAF domain-containing protein n=1 Tax=Adhaeribacter aquaticus TaxID=299567 RepID=UPI00040627D7|nr:GAF domain-containing protein [Adhaeribacter aquaticus]